MRSEELSSGRCPSGPHSPIIPHHPQEQVPAPVLMHSAPGLPGRRACTPWQRAGSVPHCAILLWGEGGTGTDSPAASSGPCALLTEQKHPKGL